MPTATFNVQTTVSANESPRVGDVGTIYSAELRALGNAYDPSDAIDTILIFKLPSGDTVLRTAEVTSTGTGVKTRWYLQYTVVASDILDGIHEFAGTYQWQGHITFSDDTTFHTTIATYTVEDNLDPLTIST